MPPLPQVILVHRILNFHPEVDVVHEDLLEDLRLLVRARAADGHVEATPLEDATLPSRRQNVIL